MKFVKQTLDLYIDTKPFGFNFHYVDVNIAFCVFMCCSYSPLKEINRKVQEATSRSRNQTPTPGGREKVTQINVCIANKQMHDKHKD